MKLVPFAASQACRKRFEERQNGAYFLRALLKGVGMRPLEGFELSTAFRPTCAILRLVRADQLAVSLTRTAALLS